MSDKEKTKKHMGCIYMVHPESRKYLITLNSKDISQEVAKHNPDPDSPAEINYQTATLTEYAIRSAISCYMEQPFNLTMTRREIMAMHHCGGTMRSLSLDMYNSNFSEDIGVIENILMKLDDVTEGK